MIDHVQWLLIVMTTIEDTLVSRYGAAWLRDHEHDGPDPRYPTRLGAHHLRLRLLATVLSQATQPALEAALALGGTPALVAILTPVLNAELDLLQASADRIVQLEGL